MSTTCVEIPSCPWCRSTDHSRPESCPKVRKVTYHPDGGVASVEKFERFESYPASTTGTLGQWSGTWSNVEMK